mgnify:CR=1 FL=1
MFARRLLEDLPRLRETNHRQTHENQEGRTQTPKSKHNQQTIKLLRQLAGVAAAGVVVVIASVLVVVAGAAAVSAAVAVVVVAVSAAAARVAHAAGLVLVLALALIVDVEGVREGAATGVGPALRGPLTTTGAG